MAGPQEEIPEESQDGTQVEKVEEKSKEGGPSWYSAPQRYGNAAGDTIQNTVGKVGQPVGQGLSYGVKPVGNVVDSLVGGVMRSGELAHDAPQKGEGVENKIREFTGNLQGQAQEALDKGAGGEAVKKVQDALKGEGGGEEVTKKVQEVLQNQGEGEASTKKVEQVLKEQGEGDDTIKKAQESLEDQGEDDATKGPKLVDKEGDEKSVI